MNTSSQNPLDALPPGLAPVRSPMPDGVRAAYAAYGVALPYVPEPAAESATEATDPCDDCLRGKHGPNAHRRGLPAAEEAPAPVTTLQAAAAVMDATMEENDAATGAELAEAERKAGILFDAEHVEAVRTAALEQARTEYAAELDEARRQLAAIAGSRRQVEAVLRLCEGRRGDDMLLVSVVAVAAECGSTALDSFPMTVIWDEAEGVQLPDAGARSTRAIVPCTSAYGGRADLVVTGEQRERLASLLGTQVRDIHAKCPTEGCGTVDDYDASDPSLFGWSRLQIASLGDEARWYCSDMCVFDALARAGHELAAGDRAAEPGGDL